jgi:CubicO group peptidase (beta-lactamase class C family)
MKRIFLLLLSFPLITLAQDKRAGQMSAYMKAEENVKQYSGVAAVYLKDKKIFDGATGYADREWMIPNTTQAKYRIGSVTKQFTAALILKLEEQGKLSTNDKLSQYYAGYPKGDSITIHMLLNHTSGIKNYTAIPGVWQSLHYKYSVDSLIRVFRDKPFDFSPGKGWNYSNSGYILLGYIIEKVSGKKYRTFLQEQILTPLGMKHSDLERLDTVYANKAKGYMKVGNSWKPAAFMELEGAWAAGAMISTTDDLNTWIRALYNNKVLNPVSTKKMLTPDAGTSGYGYGIVIDSLGKHPRIWHNGGIHGFTSFLAYYPENDMSVVSFCNNEEESADRIAGNLSKLGFGETIQLPYIPKEVKIDPAVLQNYVGKYKTPQDQLELVSMNGKLYRRRPGTPDIELKPESSTRFFYADLSDRFIEFANEKGMLQAYIIAGGQRYPMTRL